MKKAHLIPIAVTMVFIIFTVCFFIIRNFSGSRISLSKLTTGNTAETAISTHDTVSRRNTINITTATRLQLMMLPGIGENLAQRIIDYRNKHGSFQTVDDLCNVDGIGEKTLENIRDYITVGGSL